MYAPSSTFWPAMSCHSANPESADTKVSSRSLSWKNCAQRSRIGGDAASAELPAEEAPEGTNARTASTATRIAHALQGIHCGIAESCGIAGAIGAGAATVPGSGGGASDG